MAESQDIVITFKADTTGLTPAVDVLERMDKVTKKSADEFKKANEATKEFNKTAQQTYQILDGNGKALLISTDKVKKLGDETTKAGKKIKDSTAEMGKGFNTLSSSLEDIGKRIVAAFAVQQIVQFGKESVLAFAEAELNAKKLQVAVGVNGGLAKDYDELLTLSQELQKTTIFSDDSIQNASVAALQFGLTADQVKKLIPVITDFASATGQNLDTALSAVLRGAEGSARGLKLYGVEIDATKNKTEILAQIVDQLNAKFKGQAEIISGTTAGQIKVLGNAFDELKESIGSALVPAGKFLTESLLFNFDRNKFLQIKAQEGINLAKQDQEKKNNQIIAAYQEAAAKFSTDLLEKIAAKKTEIIKNGNAQEQNLARTQLTAISNILRERELLLDQKESNQDQLDAAAKQQRDANKKVLDEKQRFADDLAALEKDIAKKSELELAKTEQERLAITLKYALLELDIKRKAAGVVDTDKAYLNAKKNLYDAYDKAVLDADNKQKEQFQKNREKDIDADSKAQEAMVKNLEETNDETNKLNEEQRQLQLDLEEQFRQDKKALINQIEDEALQASFGLFQANIDAQLALLEEQTTQEQEVYDERIRLNQEQFDKRIITAKQFRAEEDKLNKEKVAAEKVAQTQINELRRKADIADRAEKVFQIAIATARNIVELTPLQAPLIPFYIALGAVQTAAVLAQPLPKYAKGTLSLQGNNDEVPIIAHRGEAITPTKQSKEYNATLRAIHERSIPAEALNNFVKGFNYKPSYVASTTTANSFSIDYDKLAKSIAWQMRGSGNVNIKNVKQIADALKQDNDVRRYRG